jgi:hypothetical protein
VRGVEIYEWVCASNDYKGSTRGCEYRNSFIEGDLLEIVKEKIKNFREDEEMLQYILNAKLSMIGNLNDITAIEEVENSIQKLMNDRESNFELFSAKIITIDEYKSRNDKIQKQLDDLNEKKTLFGHIGKEEEYIRLKLDKDFKELKEINLDNLSNAILRKVVERIEVATVDKETEQVKDVSIDFIINGASMDELMVSLFGIKTKISS